jgi:uncharacterized membrane protein YfcA
VLKGIDGKWMWAAAGMGLACVGIGAILFSRVTGIFLVFIGLLVCWLWYSKYGKKKPVVKPAAPAAAATDTAKAPVEQSTKPLSDAEAADLYKKEQDAKLAALYRKEHPGT